MAQSTASTADRTQAPPPRRRRVSWRRRLAAAHRWTSLLSAGLLVVIMAAGVPLLWGAESFRARNPDIYQATPSINPLTPQQAFEVVQTAHPNFTPGNVISDRGVYVVTDAQLNKAYGVDAGTGDITGSGIYYGGFQGFMENLHAFGLSSPDYPGYVPVLATPIPTFGIESLEGTTLGMAVVGVIGIVLMLFALSGIVLWWPGMRRLATSLRIRRGKTRYVTQRELHKTIGILAAPFLLMWGLTGAAAQFPALQQGFLAVIGGDTDQVRRLNWDFTSKPNPGADDIGLDTARKAALRVIPGTISNHTLPDPADPTSAYLFEIAESYDPYDNTMLSGNDWVYVDRYDPSRTKVVWSGHDAPWQNRLYEEVLYPSHFGWYVNGWVRMIWAAFGLAPAVLFTTGLVTWGIRARRRRHRRNHPAPAPAT
jgi:uncharacterized iron-regulated membrane protein